MNIYISLSILFISTIACNQNNGGDTSQQNIISNQKKDTMNLIQNNFGFTLKFYTKEVSKDSHSRTVIFTLESKQLVYEEMNTGARAKPSIRESVFLDEQKIEELESYFTENNFYRDYKQNYPSTEEYTTTCMMNLKTKTEKGDMYQILVEGGCNEMQEDVLYKKMQSLVSKLMSLKK